MNHFNIEKKIIIITGRTGIFGGCIAVNLANSGANVVILGRNQKND